MDTKDEEEVRNKIYEVVKKQIKDKEPPEVSKAYDRLIAEGLLDFEVINLLGNCLALEIANVFQNKQRFDEERYIRNLKRLPNGPFEGM